MTMKRDAKEVPAGSSRDPMRTAPSRADDVSHQLSNSDDDVCGDNELGTEWTGNLDCYHSAKEYMDDLRIDPPLVVKDWPKLRRLASLAEARAFVEEGIRLGQRPAWRAMYDQFRTVHSKDEAHEAIGALREMLELEGLLVPPSPPLTTQRRT
jgi:hypothetical protein